MRADAYFCLRGIAMRAARECKHDSANSNALSHRWLTKHEAGVSFPQSTARPSRAVKQLLERNVEVVDQSPQVGQ